MADPNNATIFALSSGRPPAAIAVIRVSGPRAGAALDALGVKIPVPRKAGLARIRHPVSRELIDEALVLWFPGPNSETGEDVAELQAHGGPAVIAAVLDALSGIDGLRMAEPGEFTRRGFENGKMDLTAVEGLADLVAAETEGQRRQAIRQMTGLLGGRAEDWRARLTRALALVEARIDFSDEADVPEDLVSPALGIVEALRDEIAAALADGGRGERLREGLVVAIAGPPNAGKSTLLNRIARREVAIVSPYAGTTRDVIEVHLDLGGFPVTLLDTAGIRDTEDPVELEGVRRARARAASADLVLWVVDAADLAGHGAGHEAGGSAGEAASGPANERTGGLAGEWAGGRTDGLTGGRSLAELGLDQVSLAALGLHGAGLRDLGFQGSEGFGVRGLGSRGPDLAGGSDGSAGIVGALGPGDPGSAMPDSGVTGPSGSAAARLGARGDPAKPLYGSADILTAAPGNGRSDGTLAQAPLDARGDPERASGASGFSPLAPAMRADLDGPGAASADRTGAAERVQSDATDTVDLSLCLIEPTPFEGSALEADSEPSAIEAEPRSLWLIVNKSDVINQTLSVDGVEALSADGVAASHSSEARFSELSLDELGTTTNKHMKGIVNSRLTDRSELDVQSSSPARESQPLPFARKSELSRLELAPAFILSAVSGDGVDEFLAALMSFSANHLAGAENALVTRARHREALNEVISVLSATMVLGLPEELLAEQLRQAANVLGRLTGRMDVEDVLDVIFRDFCIGK